MVFWIRIARFFESRSSFLPIIPPTRREFSRPCGGILRNSFNGGSFAGHRPLVIGTKPSLEIRVPFHRLPPIPPKIRFARRDEASFIEVRSRRTLETSHVAATWIVLFLTLATVGAESGGVKAESVDGRRGRLGWEDPRAGRRSSRAAGPGTVSRPSCWVERSRTGKVGSSWPSPRSLQAATGRPCGRSCQARSSRRPRSIVTRRWANRPPDPGLAGPRELRGRRSRWPAGRRGSGRPSDRGSRDPRTSRNPGQARSATTDAEGRAVVSAFRPEELLAFGSRLPDSGFSPGNSARPMGWPTSGRRRSRSCLRASLGAGRGRGPEVGRRFDGPCRLFERRARHGLDSGIAEATTDAAAGSRSRRSRRVL